MDRLTKVGLYLPVRTNYGGEKLAQFYVENIVKLHGVPSRIVSDRGTQFTSKFWKSLHKAMVTKLDFSSAYHAQIDCQTEQVNQIMEDMLSVCSPMERIGNRVYRMPSFPTKTVIRPV